MRPKDNENIQDPVLSNFLLLMKLQHSAFCCEKAVTEVSSREQTFVPYVEAALQLH